MIALIIVCTVLGLVSGPVLHHLGVRAAVRRPFDGLLPRCEACERTIAGTRWFATKCSECGGPRRRREFLIWVLSGLGAGGAAWVTGYSWLLPAHLVLVGVTIVLTVTDLDAFLLPNRVLYPGTVVSVGLLGAGALAEGVLGQFGRGLLTGFGYMLVLGIVSFLVPHGFGLGDAKMAFILGAFAGFWSLNAFATMLLATAILGGLPALFLLITRRASKDDHLPYGPAMIYGTWVAIAIEGRLALLG